MRTDRTKDSMNDKISPYKKSFQQLDNKDEVVMVLERKIKKLIKENNLLHCQVVEGKEYIEMLRECKELRARIETTLNGGQNRQNN